MAGTRVAVLLRGVNVGRAKRIAMSELTEILLDLGVEDVRTLLNSGNAVGTSRLSGSRLAAQVSASVEARLGFGCDVVVRTRREMEAVVARDPLAAVAVDPSRYLVVFLETEPEKTAIDRLRALDAAPEHWVLDGRELYVWMPAGITDSLVSQHLARGALGVTWTGRNRATVGRILAAM